jgi:hypothetical protein
MLTGSGFSPCTKAIAYNFSNRMNARSAWADVSITLNGEPFAEPGIPMRR